MQTDAILSSDMLDILFDKRNKEYGAYTLRKFYPQRIKTSLMVMLGIATVISAASFLPGKNNARGDFFLSDDLLVKTMELAKQPEQPKQKQIAVAASPVQKFHKNFVIVDSTESAEKLDDLTDKQIGNHTSTIPGTGPAIIDQGPPSDGPGGGEVLTVAEPAVSNDHPEPGPDVQPEFPGGEKELVRFLQRHLHSPVELEDGRVVQVRVKFVVGFDGNLQTFEVIQDGGADCNNEVVRVLKKMPRWVPGRKGGRNVPAYFTLPVKFAADE